MPQFRGTPRRPKPPKPPKPPKQPPAPPAAPPPPEPEPTPKAMELRGGDERPPIRDPQRTKTYMMPTYGECMICGQRSKQPRTHSLITTNEDDPPMVGISGTICDDCNKKHQG